MLSHQFNEALTWAANLHQNQVRKTSKTPYIAHLLIVAGLVLESGGTEAQAIAALLHDAIEDQGVTTKEIARRFGQEVADLVNALTESYSHPKPEWRERKNSYLEKLRTSSREAVLISLADKLHNARALEAGLHIHGERMWEQFFNSRKHETRWFYGDLMALYRDQGFSDNWLFIELDKLVERLFRE